MIRWIRYPLNSNNMFVSKKFWMSIHIDVYTWLCKLYNFVHKLWEIIEVCSTQCLKAEMLFLPNKKYIKWLKYLDVVKDTEVIYMQVGKIIFSQKKFCVKLLYEDVSSPTSIAKVNFWAQKP